MASKKWKKRLKRIGKVAAIAGAAALAGKLASKRRAGAMSGLTTVPDSQKEAISRAVTGTEYPGANVVPVEKPAVTTSKDVFRPRVWPGTKLGERVINPHEATAAAGAAYKPRVARPNRFNRNVVYKHGGRVTGIAKRGFGRALMKGKK